MHSRESLLITANRQARQGQLVLAHWEAISGLIAIRSVESTPLEAWTQLCPLSVPKTWGQGRRQKPGDFNFLGDQREVESS